MAFLHQTPERPSCVVAALPKRFRESLARELAGSVALTTCPVDELENVVRLRSATLAVVGASRDALEIAERLSHDAQSVKVFIAHYQDSRAPSAPLNGFAGVFDLRIEAKRLAASIRQAVAQAQAGATHPSRPAARTPQVARAGQGMVSHFIAMQKRLGNRTALLETMLDGFLGLCQADEGVLLLPGEANPERFQVVANQGDPALALRQEVTLSPGCVQSLLAGEIVDDFERIGLSTSSYSFLPRFSVAVPILVEGRLAGCLLADHGTEPGLMEEFMLGASFMLQQLARREQALPWEEFMQRARRLASAGWMLVNGQDRIVFREDSESFGLSPNSPVVQEPRLKDALAQAREGRSGSVVIQRQPISFRPLDFKNSRYCLLRAEPSAPERPPAAREAGNAALVLAAFRSHLSDSPQEREAVETLCGARWSQPGEDRNVALKTLASLGIVWTGDSAEIPAALFSRLLVVLLAARFASGQPVTGKFQTEDEAWSLTVEAAEAGLPDDCSQWQHHDLLDLGLRVTGLDGANRVRGTFGFQIQGESADWRA